MNFLREFQFRRRFQVIHINIQHTVILPYTSTFVFIYFSQILIAYPSIFQINTNLKRCSTLAERSSENPWLQSPRRRPLSTVKGRQCPESRVLDGLQNVLTLTFFLKHLHGTRGRFESQLLIGPFKYSRLSHGMMCFGVDASHWSNATITKGKIKVEWTDLFGHWDLWKKIMF